MLLDIQERLTGAASGQLQDAVRLALGDPNALLGRWEVTTLGDGAGARAGQSQLHLLSGAAYVGSSERSWRLALKALVPMADRDDPKDIRYWKREALLYGARLLDALPSGLRAPRCFGCDELEDGTFWLWLEHIQEDGERAWPPERWALAARRLGQFNGAYLDGRPLPSAPWLGARRLRTWLNHHRPLVARIAAAPRNPEVHQWWPSSVVDAILRLWDERDAFCAALERLPQTFCHGDAIRRNLFACRGADGTEETIAIDWEFAGYYAIGEEVGQTISVAAAFFDLEPADLPALDEKLFAGYLAGLRDVGWRGDPRQVRFAYAAHAALRNAFNAVGATVPDDARRAASARNQGRTWEDLAERRAAVRPFLLERADEARRLLAIL